MKKSSRAAFALVKGQCNHEISEFRFFHDSVSSNTIRAVSNFFEDIFSEIFAAQGKFAAGIVDTSGKFATGINNTSSTGGKICHRCR